MLNKNIYSLVLKDGEEIEFEALISFDKQHGKYFRVLHDGYDYEKMIQELVYKGYSGTNKISEEIIQDGENSYIKNVWSDYLIEFNDIFELKKFLIQKGFDCEIIESKNYDLITSVSADGQDIGFEVISNSNKIKISSFTQSLFKAANNSNYEPMEIDMAGSYKIELYDTKKNPLVKQELISILTNLKKADVDHTKFWENNYYYTCIKNLIGLSKIEHLKSLIIKIENRDFEFSKTDIKKIFQKVQLILSQKPFSSKSDKNTPPRAFDYKNLSFKIDTTEGVRYAKASDEDLFKKVRDNSLKTLEYTGVYRVGVKSVLIEKVSIKNS